MGMPITIEIVDKEATQKIFEKIFAENKGRNNGKKPKGNEEN